jgi:hypothetical protein
MLLQKITVRDSDHPLERLMHSINAIEPECVTIETNVSEHLIVILNHADFENVPADPFDLPSSLQYSIWRRTLQLGDEKKVMQLVEIWASKITHVWLNPFTVVRTHPVHV